MRTHDPHVLEQGGSELLGQNDRLRDELERLECEKENLIESLRVIEESRDHYVALYDEAPMAWVTLDADGLIESANVRFSTLLGFPNRRLEGTPLKALLLSDDRRRFLSYLAETRGNPAPPCHVRLMCQEGAVSVRLEGRPARAPGGSQAVAVIDLREQERANEERERLLADERTARAANDAKDQFILLLSHELRTPLTPVLMAISSLAKRADLPPEMVSTFEMLQRNIVIEAHLIDDLLDLTRITSGELRLERQPMDLHQAARAIAESLQHEISQKNQTLHFQLSAERPWVNGDVGRLGQVVHNLLKNAWKFTPEGGRIELRSWNLGQRLMLEVRDSGRGISAVALPRLFLPFEHVTRDRHTTRGSLGLGLAIARGITELHGGRLVAASAGEGLGARFVIELDAVEAPEAVSRRESVVPPPGAVKPRVILVEDHEDSAEMLSAVLRGAGYEVLMASSVESALELPIVAEDLLVSDLGLQDGNGLDLMRRLRERMPLRGIALSGYGTESDKRASKEAGFAVHLTKPVDMTRFLEALSRVSALK